MSNPRPRNRQPLPLAPRLWAKVQKTDGCWEWTGFKTPAGYGVIRYGRKKILPTHRVAYELTHGPIPTGLDVCHTCDNPSCVRPDHLFLGTHTDNMRDAQVKGRLATGERSGARRHPEKVTRGEANGKAVFTSAQVLEIRATYARGGITHKQLAALHEVSVSAIAGVLRRRTWKHL